MKPSILAVALSLAAPLPASAQFSIGYGAGYFHTGQKSMNQWVNNFNNNPDLSYSFGPISQAGQLLPFSHGFTAAWSAPLRANGSLKFHVDVQNLRNSAKSVRVDWQNTYFYHRVFSGMNSLYLGAEKTLTGKGLATRLFSSFLVRGYVANYQLKYAIGIGEDYSKKWHNKLSFFDCGFDLGAYLYSNSRARVLMHYSHSLMQLTTAKSTPSTEANGYTPSAFVPNTSYAGIKLLISLGKFTPRPDLYEEVDPQSNVVSNQ